MQERSSSLSLQTMGVQLDWPPYRWPVTSLNCLQVLEDMAGPATMHRLLQGDVGSGKTIVAFLAMLAAAGSGWQAALMAPTEVRKLNDRQHAAPGEF